jgi:hypothetical protein
LKVGEGCASGGMVMTEGICELVSESGDCPKQTAAASSKNPITRKKRI